MISLLRAKANLGLSLREFFRSVVSALVNRQRLVETMQLEHSHYLQVDAGKPQPCAVLLCRLISRDEAGHAGAVYACHGREINQDAIMCTDVLKEQLQDRYRVIEI